MIFKGRDKEKASTSYPLFSFICKCTPAKILLNLQIKKKKKISDEQVLLTTHHKSQMYWGFTKPLRDGSEAEGLSPAFPESRMKTEELSPQKELQREMQTILSLQLKKKKTTTLNWQRIGVFSQGRIRTICFHRKYT